MARTASLDGIAQKIASLIKTRSIHQSAIESIDAAVARIQAALSGGRLVPSAASKGKKRGPKPGSKRRSGRGSFARTADESVLAFVKKAGTPTTKQVNEHWKGEGRGGSANNALTKLVQSKKLKRLAVKGERGSKYSIA